MALLDIGRQGDMITISPIRLIRTAGLQVLRLHSRNISSGSVLQAQLVVLGNWPRNLEISVMRREVLLRLWASIRRVGNWRAEDIRWSLTHLLERRVL